MLEGGTRYAVCSIEKTDKSAELQVYADYIVDHTFGRNCECATATCK